MYLKVRTCKRLYLDTTKFSKNSKQLRDNIEDSLSQVLKDFLPLLVLTVHD